MKPIAMRCTQKQFDKIKNKLSHLSFIMMDDDFTEGTYLINNLSGVIGSISNIEEEGKNSYDRTVFEEWDEDVFLEYCDVEVFPKDWYIEATEENFSVLDEWRFNQTGEKCTSFKVGKTLLSKHMYDVSYYYLGSAQAVTIDEDYKDYKRITFDQFKKHVLKQPDMGQKLTVPITEVKRIYDIACSGWKKTIADYLKRVDANLDITFTKVEVDTMFKAANGSQTTVLESVFGKKVPAIDYDRITTGSVVKIRSTGQCINDLGHIDEDEEAYVVFFKTPHGIFNDGEVFKTEHYGNYCTFIQNGKIILFSAHTKIDYITEVISY